MLFWSPFKQEALISEQNFDAIIKKSIDTNEADAIGIVTA